MGKRDLLFLAHRIPYPPDKGDKIRSWHLLRHLSETWNVHLGCFIDDPRDDQYCDHLKSVTASQCFVRINPNLSKVKSLLGLITNDPLSFAFYRSRQLRDYVATVHRDVKPAAQVGFSSAMAGFLLEPDTKIPTLIDFCDCDAEKWRAYAQSKSGIGRMIYAREAQTLTRSENLIIERADAAFAITASEAQLFNQRKETTKTVGFFGNGVDTSFYAPNADFTPFTDKRAEIIFVGAMDYLPNVEAVTWFVSDVWPHLQSNHPNIRFAIVGSKPTAAVKALSAHKNITVTGRVDDVRPWLEGADISVAPLRIGRGIQNKVLEAMAMERSVIASHEAGEGIDAIDGTHLIKTADAPAMIAAINQLLNDADQRAKIGTAARAYVKNNHSWSAKLHVVDECLARLVG